MCATTEVSGESGNINVQCEALRRDSENRTDQRQRRLHIGAQVCSGKVDCAGRMRRIPFSAKNGIFLNNLIVLLLHHAHFGPVVGELSSAVETDDIVSGGIRGDSFPVAICDARSAWSRGERLGSTAMTTGEREELKDFLQHTATTFRQTPGCWLCCGCGYHPQH